jgi:hypothetical protein
MGDVPDGGVPGVVLCADEIVCARGFGLVFPEGGRVFVEDGQLMIEGDVRTMQITGPADKTSADKDGGDDA